MRYTYKRRSNLACIPPGQQIHTPREKRSLGGPHEIESAIVEQWKRLAYLRKAEEDSAGHDSGKIARDLRLRGCKLFELVDKLS